MQSRQQSRTHLFLLLARTVGALLGYDQAAALCLERVGLNTYVEKFKYADACGGEYSYAHHTDFIRLEKLLERGGIYADLDTIFVNKLPEHFFEKEFIMGEEKGLIVNGEYHRSLCNGWLMSAPGARFAQKEYLRQTLLSRVENVVLYSKDFYKKVERRLKPRRVSMAT